MSSVEDIVRDVQTEKRKAAEELVAASSSSSDAAAEGVEMEDVAVMEPSPSSIYDTVEASVKYKSYVRRQHKDMASWRKAQGARIPPDMEYSHANLPTLSSEELEKLSLVRPATFADASQISGITPQSLVYLYHHVQARTKAKKHVGKKAEASQVVGS